MRRLTKKGRCALILAVSVLSVGCDQATKSIAEAYLSETEAWSFLGDTVRLQLAHNQGAFLSLGAALPEAWREALFSVGAGCLLTALLVYLLFARSASSSVILACTLLFSGGLGNLADRLMYGGYVVDFINIGIGPLRTGIFNVADLAITVGEFILVTSMLRESNTGFRPGVLS